MWTPRSARAVLLAATFAANVVFASCGGEAVLGPGFGTPLGPETPQRLTVTITAAGVNPPAVRPPICRSSHCVVYVRFVNEDAETHEIRSDPHPEHSQCRALNDVGRLGPGESREVSMFLCQRPERWAGYHDETRPEDARFQGRVEEQ